AWHTCPTARRGYWCGNWMWPLPPACSRRATLRSGTTTARATPETLASLLLDAIQRRVAAEEELLADRNRRGVGRVVELVDRQHHAVAAHHDGGVAVPHRRGDGVRRHPAARPEDFAGRQVVGADAAGAVDDHLRLAAERRDEGCIPARLLVAVRRPPCLARRG